MRCDNVNLSACFLGKSLCQSVKASMVASHQDKIVSAMRQPIGVYCTDPRGRARYERCTFRGNGHVASPYIRTGYFEASAG
jgi:hypothetical protein